MADYAISNVPRRVVYAASGTGPYAFTFEILSQTDIAVYKASTLLTLTTDYTVTINANGTGSVTLVTTAGTSNITIVGSKNIQRTTDFTTGGDLFANTLNDELDNQTIFIQQVAETAERGLKAPVTDPTDIAMTLPAKDGRKGKVLAFDSTTGNPVAGPALDAVVTVIEQSANINTVADNIADVIIVADDIADVNTVAGVAGNVTTVATNIANVNAVGSDLLEATSEINTVAVDIANVNTVGTNIASVNTNATNIASINTNASNIVAIQNASTNATNAASSASAASTSATNAASSASAASSSASSASTSATNAASSASTASTQATNASNSASAASTSATNAANSASAASTSASNASTSETNAASSATAASGSASTASTQATNAANSASAASTSATNASNSASAAAASYDSFDDRYLGAKSSAPALDNDGNALLTGALYFNTVDNTMKVWNGASWLDAYASLSGALIATNNLADLTNQATARTNLGLGTAATTASTDYATAAQGTKADSALQPAAIGVSVQAYDVDISTVSASQAEMEAGTETALRSMSPLRVKQAISANAPQAFPSGTLMLFQQTAAPTGWVKQTAHDNKALRVVSGTAGSGGSTVFTSVFANQTPTVTLSGLTAAATTLSTAQIPSHNHNIQIGVSNGYTGGTPVVNFGSISGFADLTSAATGGNGSHSHSVSGSASASAITLNVQYVDLIIASKS